MMKIFLLAAAAVLFGTIAASAQVACSPDVEPVTCKAVATQWNIALDHVILRGATVSVELVTPREFNQRVAQIHKEDAALGMRCGGCPPAYSGAPKYQAFDNLWTDDVLFLRERGGRNPFPGRVLVSTDIFSDLATDKNGQPILEDFENEQGKGKRLVMDHKFHYEKMSDIFNFIVGYFQGMWASFADSEVLPMKDSK